METLERLSQIAKTKFTDLSEDDKQFIIGLSYEHGIPFNPQKRGCKECDKFKDMAVLLYSKIKDIENVQSEREYMLYDNIDVDFKGERINNATLTDEKAEQLIALKFPKRWFIKFKE